MHAQIHNHHAVNVKDWQNDNGFVLCLFVPLQQKEFDLRHAGGQISMAEYSSFGQSCGAARVLQAGRIIRRQRKRRVFLLKTIFTVFSALRHQCWRLRGNAKFPIS